MVAGAALLGRYWPKGARHDASLAIAGVLLRHGWSADRGHVYPRSLAAAADAEVNDRVAAVNDTVAKLAAGLKTTGWPSLEKILGVRGGAIISAMRAWLNLPTITPSAARQVAAPKRSVNRYVPITPYVPFPTDCLPSPWDQFVREGACALRCDEALVALPILSVLAGAIGNTRRVYLGAEWYEPAVIWTCVIAESGGRKSPAAELSVDLIQARQRALVKVFKQQMVAYKQEMSEYKRRQGEDVGEAPEKPVLRRVVVGDVTIEKLAGLLDDNPRGLLTYRDELSGWVNSFTRYSGTGGSDESIWLSMHPAGPLAYDRKSGDKTTVYVPNAAVSVTGGIQPGTAARIMTTAYFESGLVGALSSRCRRERPRLGQTSASRKRSARQP